MPALRTAKQLQLARREGRGKIDNNDTAPFGTGARARGEPACCDGGEAADGSVAGLQALPQDRGAPAPAETPGGRGWTRDLRASGRSGGCFIAARF